MSCWSISISHIVVLLCKCSLWALFTICVSPLYVWNLWNRINVALTSMQAFVSSGWLQMTNWFSCYFPCFSGVLSIWIQALCILCGWELTVYHMRSRTCSWTFFCDAVSYLETVGSVGLNLYFVGVEECSLGDNYSPCVRQGISVSLA